MKRLILLILCTLQSLLAADIATPLAPWQLMPALSKREVTTLTLKDVVTPPVIKLSDQLLDYVTASKCSFLEFTPGPMIMISQTAVTFSTDKGSIVIDTKTGDVTLPPGLKPSAAAKEFWKAVKALRKYSQLPDE